MCQILFLLTMLAKHTALTFAFECHLNRYPRVKLLIENLLISWIEKWQSINKQVRCSTDAGRINVHDIKRASVSSLITQDELIEYGLNCGCRTCTVSKKKWSKKFLKCVDWNLRYSIVVMASNLSVYPLLHTTIGSDPVSRLTPIYEGPGTILQK